jgi:dipeptidase E
MSKVRLLLVSSSKTHGSDYLDHCCEQIRELVGDRSGVLFVPYALHDLDAYTARARERFRDLGYGLDSVHESDDPVAAVARAEAIFIGGGNTFRLLKGLEDHQLLEPIRRRVEKGVPYIGTSAGSNVACPSIQTTNDMPIVQPRSFAALALVPFNLNPHYLDADPSSTHQGESRDKRIAEFLEENDQVVVALREGSMLRVEGSEITLLGAAGGRLFRRGFEPEELQPGARIDRTLS